jgi:hypothetical protein
MTSRDFRGKKQFAVLPYEEFVSLRNVWRTWKTCWNSQGEKGGRPEAHGAAGAGTATIGLEISSLRPWSIRGGGGVLPGEWLP